MTPRRLTDEEICKKFALTKDDPAFVAARLLSDTRPDSTICVLPEILCPHCCREFTATYEDVRHGKEMPCEACERIIWITRIELPDDEEGDVVVALSTHPEEE